jgi:hypothetical protein
MPSSAAAQMPILNLLLEDGFGTKRLKSHAEATRKPRGSHAEATLSGLVYLARSSQHLLCRK